MHLGTNTVYNDSRTSHRAHITESNLFQQEYERHSERVKTLKEQATQMLNEARKATNTPPKQELSPELMIVCTGSSK